MAWCSWRAPAVDPAPCSCRVSAAGESRAERRREPWPVRYGERTSSCARKGHTWPTVAEAHLTDLTDDESRTSAPDAASAHAWPSAVAAACARAPAVPYAPARVVPPPWARPAVANHRRPVPHPRVRDDAPADAGGSRAAEVLRMARQIPLARRVGRCSGGRRHERLAPAWLQHPAHAPAIDRAGGRQQV